MSKSRQRKSLNNFKVFCYYCIFVCLEDIKLFTLSVVGHKHSLLELKIISELLNQGVS